MPITVSCPACSSRFSLSDDLYRRRVAGSLVKVKCRHCSAEIAVDATESVTMPSQETQRKHPHPPRRNTGTQLGLGTPPPPTELATSSPLPLDPTRSPLPLNATVTPLPTDAAPPMVPPADAESIWGDEPTLAINVANSNPPPRPPIARRVSGFTESERLELIEAEEVPASIEAEEMPASSSGTPTLDVLTLEAGGAHVPHGKPAPDEFLVSLSAANDGLLRTGSDGNFGGPTIDVTGFAAELNSPNADRTLESDDDEREYHPARSRTAPAFEAGEHRRERKFVIPPNAEEGEAMLPKLPRSSAPVWLGLLVAAAAVAAFVGSRGLRWMQPISTDSALAPPAQPVVHNQAALPAEAPTPEVSEITSATPTSSAVAPVAASAGAVTPQSTAPSTAVAVKSSVNTASKQTEKPSTVAEPAAEKADVSASPVEAHNSPSPAPPETEFDRDAARNALATAATQASACRKVGDPSGTANLTITFAPSGRVTSAQIQGPPFSGTATGGCIASTMRRASVPAFSGDYVTVSKTIVIQ